MERKLRKLIDFRLYMYEPFAMLVFWVNDVISEREDFAGEVNFDFFIYSFFPALKWHLIYHNWSRHSHFTIEKGSKTLIVFFIIFTECFHVYQRKPTASKSMCCNTYRQNRTCKMTFLVRWPEISCRGTKSISLLSSMHVLQHSLWHAWRHPTDYNFRNFRRWIDNLI